MISKINNWKNQIQQAVYDDYRKVASNADFDNGTEYGYYPNPTHDYINISTNDSFIERVNIMDLNGKLIYENKFTEKVNVSNLNAGMYVLKIMSKEGKQTLLKFIKE